MPIELSWHKDVSGREEGLRFWEECGQASGLALGGGGDGMQLVDHIQASVPRLRYPNLGN